MDINESMNKKVLECNKEFECAPILIIGFNRPDFMRQQIRNIAVCRPRKVFVAVDGGRNAKEWVLCNETRSAVNLIDWKCEVKTYFRDENRGCRYAPPEAITWFFEQVESGIILEDDCHPAPEFFRFATELLERYKEDTRIGAVTAFNRYNLQSDEFCSYHFSKEFNVWGWASWRRVWENYDITMDRYAHELDNLVVKHTNNRRMKKYWNKCFSLVREGALSTWDYQVACMFMARGYLSVIPRERLVANCGFGLATAEHTAGYDFFATEFSKFGHIEFPLIHPALIEPDIVSDEKTERIMMGILPVMLFYAGNCLPKPLQPLVTLIGRFIYFVAPRLFEI